MASLTIQIGSWKTEELIWYALRRSWVCQAYLGKVHQLSSSEMPICLSLPFLQAVNCMSVVRLKIQSSWWLCKMETCAQWSSLYCEGQFQFEFPISKHCFHVGSKTFSKGNVLSFIFSGSILADMQKSLQQILTVQFNYFQTVESVGSLQYDLPPIFRTCLNVEIQKLRFVSKEST